MAPIAPATESERLWSLARQLERRVAELERRDDLAPLRVELGALAREVAGLRDDLIDVLKADRGSLLDALTHAEAAPPPPPAAPPPRPVTSLGPPREVRAHLRAWVGWAMVALAGATATALTAAILALAKGCGG